MTGSESIVARSNCSESSSTLQGRATVGAEINCCCSSEIRRGSSGMATARFSCSGPSPMVTGQTSMTPNGSGGSIPHSVVLRTMVGKWPSPGDVGTSRRYKRVPPQNAGSVAFAIKADRHVRVANRGGLAALAEQLGRCARPDPSLIARAVSRRLRRGQGSGTEILGRLGRMLWLVETTSGGRLRDRDDCDYRQARRGLDSLRRRVR